MDKKLFFKSRLDTKTKEFTKNHKESKKIKIKVLCKRSVNEKSLFFNNKIERKDLNNLINTQLFNIINADGKEVSSDDLPFDLYKSGSDKKTLFLEHNEDTTRIPSILKIYDVDFEENVILKCYGKTFLGHEVGCKGFVNDFVRVFVIQEINDDVWQVVLLDPNHLVATEKYKELYNECNNFNYGIEEIDSPY